MNNRLGRFPTGKRTRTQAIVLAETTPTQLFHARSEQPAATPQTLHERRPASGPGAPFESEDDCLRPHLIAYLTNDYGAGTRQPRNVTRVARQLVTFSMCINAALVSTYTWCDVNCTRTLSINARAATNKRRVSPRLRVHAPTPLLTDATRLCILRIGLRVRLHSAAGMKRKPRYVCTSPLA